jgi:hypothetical protein
MCVLDLWDASYNLQFPSNAEEIGYDTFDVVDMLQEEERIEFNKAWPSVPQD